MSSELVRELEALDAKATKGPWFMVGPPWNYETQYINAASADPHGGRIVCDFECQWDQYDGEDDSLAPRPLEDAITIVALRNCLPALIEFVKAADEVKRLGIEHDSDTVLPCNQPCSRCRAARVRYSEAQAALLSALRGGK